MVSLGSGQDATLEEDEEAPGTTTNINTNSKKGASSTAYSPQLEMVVFFVMWKTILKSIHNLSIFGKLQMLGNLCPYVFHDLAYLVLADFGKSLSICVVFCTFMERVWSSAVKEGAVKPMDEDDSDKDDRDGATGVSKKDSSLRRSELLVKSGLAKVSRALVKVPPCGQWIILS